MRGWRFACSPGTGRSGLDMSDDAVAELRKKIEAAGLQAASVTTGALVGHAADGERSRRCGRQGVQAVKQCLRVGERVWARRASWWCRARWRSSSIPRRRSCSTTSPLDRVREAMQELVPVAEKNKVAIGIENVWNKLFLSPVELRDFIDSFGSEYLGSFFDVGNVLLTGFPEQWIRILGKRIKKVHVKDYRKSVGTIDGFVDLLEGSVNWPEVMKALREVGYNDYLIAEMIPGYTFSPRRGSRIRAWRWSKIMKM